MLRRPPRSTRTDTLFPYTTLFRSTRFRAAGGLVGRWDRDVGAQAVDDEGAEREPQTLLQLRRLGEGSEVDVGGELLGSGCHGFLVSTGVSGLAVGGCARHWIIGSLGDGSLGGGRALQIGRAHV